MGSWVEATHFTCSGCGYTFEKVNDEKEATEVFLREQAVDGQPITKLTVVCEDCYEDIEKNVTSTVLN
jgi:hypothetical protein